MLTKEEVQHIAALARIGLSAKEIEKFQGELGTILEFVGKLNEVDTTGIEPTAQVTGLVNALRDDAISGREPEAGSRELLLAQAPQREKNYVKVKAVFE